MRLVTDPPCPWRFPEMFVSTVWMLVVPSTSTDGWNFLQNLAFCHVTMSPAFKSLFLARFSGLNPGDIAMVTNGMWGCGDVGMGLPSSSLQATHKGSRGLCSNTRLIWYISATSTSIVVLLYCTNHELPRVFVQSIKCNTPRSLSHMWSGLNMAWSDWWIWSDGV